MTETRIANPKGLTMSNLPASFLFLTDVEWTSLYLYVTVTVPSEFDTDNESDMETLDNEALCCYGSPMYIDRIDANTLLATFERDTDRGGF